MNYHQIIKPPQNGVPQPKSQPQFQAYTKIFTGQANRQQGTKIVEENQSIQKDLEFQDNQVRKKVHELNTFIQQVKSALDDKNLDSLDQLLHEVDNPFRESQQTQQLEREEVVTKVSLGDNKNYKRVDIKDKSVIIYQAKANEISAKVPEKEKVTENSPKTSKELSKLLQNMQTLLEKNLSESNILKTQLKNSNLVNGILQQKNDNNVFQNDININNVEFFKEEMTESEKQLNQIQIQRLLDKIQDLSIQIQKLQSLALSADQNYQQLKQTMLSSFCVSSVDYVETSVHKFIEHLDSNQQSLQNLNFEKIFIKIRKNTVVLQTKTQQQYLTINSVNSNVSATQTPDIDERLTFRTIQSNQIKDVFYPDKEKNIIAIVYLPEEKDQDFQQTEQLFRPTNLHSMTGPQAQMLEYSKNIGFQNNLQVLIFQYENEDDLQQWDLALWSICRRSLALNQKYLFENEMFERPFYDEFSVFDYGNQDLDKLRLIVEGVMQNKHPKEIQKSTQEMERQRSVVKQMQQSHISQSGKVPKAPLITSIKRSEIQQSQAKLIEVQKVKLTPRSMILQSSADVQSKIYRAIGLLKSGFCVIKYSSNQLRPNQRVIYLLDNEITLKWKEPLKSFERSKSANKGKADPVSEKRSIQLSKVKSVKDYADGPGFAKFRKQREGRENLAITIEADRNLEIDASSLEEKNLILECLKLALQNPVIKKLLVKV